ncbi:hypothetical protein CPC16_010438 [Podila verticillata]|nr:hypothetical protein BGZ52_009695 [Haplosporangium bisporale]KAF9207134.1 hypothetical protein BGZ59_011334 [Podila verticillata]KAF9380169.1 hypothetical protein CPC16_010438 [Podila verticillata]KAI9232757.1 MAG: hypothetical protein BYD32DRAFT_440672 [Podila humilis]KFH64228.1 hypothetical protein MVEG_10053 [Podila verticillata NRRL 6337]
MTGSPKTTVVENKVETTITTTSSVEEAVSFLEVLDSNPTRTKTTAQETRELPIFSNPLLANATQANSVPIKPRTVRVKASGGKTVQVLRISAPKVEGEVVVMRRMDTDLVNATAMFNAAYPAISEKMNAKESSFVARKYNGILEKAGILSGVWISIPQARDLAKEYGIDAFMRPLLEAPAPKAKEVAIENVEQTTIVAEVVQETVVEETMEDATPVVDAIAEATEQIQEMTVSEVTSLKRRIEELEDQASRDQKRLRGLVTVAVGAVGIAAATVIPQVLPYFS